jgi:glycerol-3-phosphate acyltransferase PlsX
VTEPLIISIDAMGGDHGPPMIISALALVIKEARNVDVGFVVHGEAVAVAEALRGHPTVAQVCESRPSTSVIGSDAKPAHAMRRGRGSSMWNAVECVQLGAAGAAVSAGNTGALMAISRLQLRMVGGMDRPALVASWPTSKGVTSVLDVGANIVCDADRLVEFAILGAAFHRAVHGVTRPTIGLLNVGVESEKGHEEVRGAHRLLSEAPYDFDYRGFVEGDDIAKGSVDVIVTDGFTGNVALKTAEGLARFFRNELRAALTATLSAKLGAFVARDALRAMAKRLDPGSVNGGPFLGLKGIVVKSHGGADAAGFAHAVEMAIDLARSDFTRAIERDLGDKEGRRILATRSASIEDGETTGEGVRA